MFFFIRGWDGVDLLLVLLQTKLLFFNLNKFSDMIHDIDADDTEKYNLRYNISK